MVTPVRGEKGVMAKFSFCFSFYLHLLAIVFRFFFFSHSAGILLIMLLSFRAVCKFGRIKRHNRTERDTQGVGRDILIPKKLFLELCGPRGNSFS